MVASDYGSTDLKDLEATKPNKKEKRPPTSSLIVVLLQGVMQVGGFTAIIPTAAMYVEAVGGCHRCAIREGLRLGAGLEAAPADAPLVRDGMQRGRLHARARYWTEWKSNFGPPRHRRDIVSVAASARWRSFHAVNATLSP
jgi:hypothetical protein